MRLAEYGRVSNL